MPLTERAATTTVRALVAPDDDDAQLVAEMAAQLPPEGLASGRVPVRHQLLRATYRLLDGQILATALSCLDQDVAGPVARWLATYQGLRTAASRTISDATHREVVTLRRPTRLTSVQSVEVVVRAFESDVANFPFRLEFGMEFGETSAVLREGAVHEVTCQALGTTAELTLADTPLWKRAAPPLTLELVVRPAVRVPLVPVPRGAEVPSGHPGSVQSGTRGS